MEPKSARNVCVAVTVGMILGSSIPGSSLPDPSTIPDWSDKAIHFLEFLIWSIFARLAHERRTGRGLKVLMLTVLLGSAMEAYQSLIPGRSAEFLDVLAGIAGAILGQTLVEPHYPPPRSTIIID